MPPMDIPKISAQAEKGDADAQFALSQVCRQSGDTNGMVKWLTLAGGQRQADALNELGNCFERGIGVARDFGKAIGQYSLADQGGSASAAWRKARLLYKSSGGGASEAEIKALLTRAARADVVPALRSVGYLAMHSPNGRQLALNCLRRAAFLGDPVSSFTLAWLLPQGPAGPGVQEEAVMWLRQAADARFPFASSVLAAKQHLSPGPKPDENDTVFKWQGSFEVFPQVPGPQPTRLCADPQIAVFPAVLSIVDCAYLMHLSGPHLKRAEVIKPDGKKESMVSQVRTSSSTYLPFGLVDVIARCVETKILRAVGERLENSEPMSILRYAPGQYYRPHVDYFSPRLEVSKSLLEDGGQRTASAVSYLSVPASGGHTHFPRLKLSVPPLPGATLWFRNCRPDGSVDDRSLHSGEAVQQGEKWVVTKWFRERETSYLEY